tara:strand:- start:195 stop:443 length:249 start_codon:yes stop_codon:yes gene_type:complete
MPCYPQDIYVLFQQLKKIIRKFHGLPLSIELFHFFYSGAIDRLGKTGLLKKLGWWLRMQFPSLNMKIKLMVENMFSTWVFCV